METHAEREKIHPRCKRAHVRAPEVAIKLLWVKKCFNLTEHHAHVPCWRLFLISSLCDRYETPWPTFVRTALDETGR